MGCPSIRSLSAAELIATIGEHNPSLAKALAAIAIPQQKGRTRRIADTTWRCFAATYPYGATIVDGGHFQPPCGKSSCEDCAKLASDCAYSGIPVGFVLSNSIEVYLEPKKKNGSRDESERYPVPIRMLSTGEIFGVFETLQVILRDLESRSPWSVSAGAKSVWVLAPLGDQRLTQVLEQKLKRRIKWDEDDDEHWSLVEQTMRGLENWRVEIAFLPQQIVELLKSDETTTRPLNEILLTTAWQQSAALRRSATIDAGFRQTFLDGPGKSVSSEFNDVYLFATLCHLLAISRGDAPAFQPAGAAATPYGPFKEFEKTLHAALKTIRREPRADEARYPVVLQPVHLNAPGDCGLYSFRCPTLPGLRRPRVNNYKGLVEDVKSAVERLLRQLKENERDGMTGNHAWDEAGTAWFAQKGEYDMKGDGSRVGWQRFLSHVRSSPDLFKKERLAADSPFLVAGVQIVRGK